MMFLVISGAPSLPAACADCIETTRLTQPGLPPIQNAMQQFRSAEGKMRINFGSMSLISNPLTQERILLDHSALEARIMSAVPGAPKMPPIPGLPPMSMPQLGLPQIGSPMSKVMQMEQLGKALIEGHEVQGTRYLLGPPAAPTTWELWTSTKLSLPVLTRTIGPFGQKECICKCTPMQTPSSMFEVPPGYKIIHA